MFLLVRMMKWTCFHSARLQRKNHKIVEKNSKLNEVSIKGIEEQKYALKI